MYIMHNDMSDYDYLEYPTGLIDFFVKKRDGSSQTFTVDTFNARKVLANTTGTIEEYQRHIVGDLMYLVDEEENL